MQSLVFLILQKLPFYRALFTEFIVFADVLPHKDQLLSGVRHVIAVCQPHIAKLIGPLSRHFGEQRRLAVHHLVVGKYEHKLFTVSIHHAKGQLIVAAGAEIRIGLDIAQIIVHKAHIPLEVKSKSVVIQISRNLRPCRRLLGDHQHAFIPLFHNGIEVLQKFDRLQIFIASIQVGDPLSVPSSIVQIKHGRHRIHTDSVRMVFLHPVERVCDQIVLHLGSSVVVDQRSPVRVKALSRILMLVQAGAVKAGQALYIPWEMCRNPVEDHADPCLVQLVHKIHEILCRSISRRRCIVADHLISPGLIQRVLHHRHQLYMRVSHLLHILYQKGRQFPVSIEFPSVVGLCKGTQINLVNIDRLILRLHSGTVFQPLCIFPGKSFDLPHDRSRLRSQLRSEAIRIRLHKGQSALRLDLKFIAVSLFDIRDKKLKDPGIPEAVHLVHAAIPVIEIADYADADRIGRPNGEAHARNAIDRRRMRSQLFIDRIVDPGAEQFGVLPRDLRQEIIGVLRFFQRAVLILHHIFVSRNGLARQKKRKISLLVRLLHLIALIFLHEL